MKQILNKINQTIKEYNNAFKRILWFTIIIISSITFAVFISEIEKVNIKVDEINNQLAIINNKQI